MANFKTHIVGSASVGSVMSTLLLAIGSLPSSLFFSGIILTCIGGILPDIDSTHSNSIRLIFNILGVSLGIIMAKLVIFSLGILPALIILLLTFLLIRYIVLVVFVKYTIHRGIFHSIPMALFFTFSTVIIKVNLFGNDLISSWSIAIMLLFGFITHLVLDEICSVNLMNIRVKKSFGSAVKFFDKSNTSGYLILYLLLSLLFIRTPTITPFLKVVYAKLNKLVFLTPLGKNLLVYLLNQLDN